MAEEIDMLDTKAGDGIILHDIEGCIMQVNSVILDMTGYTEQEMLGLNIKELQPKTKRDTDIKPITLDIFDDTKVEVIKTVIVRKNGSRFPADVKTSFIRFYHDGQYITVAQRVVRDTKVFESRSKDLKTAISGNLLREVNIYDALDAELKNALLEIHDSIRVLEKEIPIDRFSSLLSLSRSSLDYARDIFSDAINIMKTNNEDIDITSNDFSLNELLSEIAKLYEEQLRKRQIQFYINLDQSIQEVVHADEPKIRYMLERLLRCLLRNNQSGRISLTVDCKDLKSLSFKFESSSFVDENIDLNSFKEDLDLKNVIINKKYADFVTSQILTNGYLKAMGGQYVASDEDGIISVTMVVPVKYQKKQSYDEQLKRFLSGHQILFIDEEKSSGEVISDQLSRWGASVVYLDSETEATEILRQNSLDKGFSFILHNAHRQDGSYAALIRSVSTYLDNLTLIDKCIYVVFTPGGFLPHVARHFARVRHTHLHSPIRIEYLGNKLARLIGEEEPYPGVVIPNNGTVSNENSKSISGRILVVDDGKVTQKVTAMTLSACGLEVDCADNGVEALSCVEKKYYDVILMDIVMPGMDGIEVTRRIREQENHKRHTPILAVTGNLKDSVWKKCVYAGMDDYMTKPIDSQQLTATVKYWMGEGEVVDPFKIESERESSSRNPTAGNATNYLGILDTDIIDRMKADTSNQIVLEMMELYRLETDERLALIDSKVKSGDLNGVAIEAHAIMSSSATFGAKKMQEQAHELEKAAENKLPIKCAEIFKNVLDTFAQTSERMKQLA